MSSFDSLTVTCLKVLQLETLSCWHMMLLVLLLQQLTVLTLLPWSALSTQRVRYYRRRKQTVKQVKLDAKFSGASRHRSTTLDMCTHCSMLPAHTAGFDLTWEQCVGLLAFSARVVS